MYRWPRENGSICPCHAFPRFIVIFRWIWPSWWQATSDKSVSKIWQNAIEVKNGTFWSPTCYLSFWGAKLGESDRKKHYVFRGKFPILTHKYEEHWEKAPKRTSRPIFTHVQRDLRDLQRLWGGLTQRQKKSVLGLWSCFLPKNQNHLWRRYQGLQQKLAEKVRTMFRAVWTQGSGQFCLTLRVAENSLIYSISWFWKVRKLPANPPNRLLKHPQPSLVFWKSQGS